jgi:hypothetical protein
MEENIEAENKGDDIPDSEDCQARAHTHWDDGITHCLVEHPVCNFSLRFGGLVLCRHPQRKEIVERTKAMVKALEAPAS